MLTLINDDPVGLGVGTRTCSNFIIETVEIGDDGDLTERALKSRLVYLQWANGFMTALNIRYFEQLPTSIRRVQAKKIQFDQKSLSLFHKRLHLS